MCFSAAASFASGGALLCLGLCSILLIPCCDNSTALSKRQRCSLGLVAAIPLIFGAHQISEGFVWTDFENEHAVRSFAYTAYIVWPLYISLALAATEWTRRPVTQQTDWTVWPSHLMTVTTKQRALIFHTVLAFALVGVVLGEMISNDPNTVTSNNGRLQYEGWSLNNGLFELLGSAIYVYCVVGSLIVSSLRYSTLFGVMVFISLVISLWLWQHQFPSTWCFFSAVLSSIVILIVWSELQLYKQESDDGAVVDIMIQDKHSSKHLEVDNSV